MENDRQPTNISIPILFRAFITSFFEMDDFNRKKAKDYIKQINQ